MTIRTLTAFCVLALLSGCQWESRPDGSEADHSNRDGYSDDVTGTPLGGTQTEVVEPLGDPVAAPAPLTQPPPATGTTDAPSEVEEPLDPGTDP